MTLQEIAKRLGVSHTTISRALNPEKAHLISAPLREKIQILAVRMHYVPNRTAQELVRGRTHTIGVVLSTVFSSVFFSDYLSKVVSGVYGVLGAKPRYSCKLIVLPRTSDLQVSHEYILGAGIDGLLISSIGDFSAELYEHLARRLASRWQKPVVGLNMTCKPVDSLSVVSFDNRKAAHEGVTHLIQRGHHRIGLIWADNASLDVRERILGYKQALEDHSLKIDPACMVEGNFLAEGGYQAALSLLKKKEARPTALFCVNDEMAAGAIQAVKALRLRCPGDVAVMGFDGLELGRFLEPKLTTIRQPTQEIAEAGTKLLLDILDGKRKGSHALKLSADLLVRDSV